MSRWQVKLKNGQVIGIRMTRRSASIHDIHNQLQEIVHRMLLDTEKKRDIKIIDWDWIETDEEWDQITRKYFTE